MVEEHAPQQRERAVFLTDFVDVDRPLPDVRRRMCGLGDWLVPLADAATDDGDAVLVRLSPTAVGRGAGVVARIHLGDCAERGGRIFLPIRWEAAAHSGLFPVLDGDLEFAALGDAHCRVAIQASYRPPLEGLGRLLDAVALHRVAESTVRSFLGRLAQHLEQDETGRTPTSSIARRATGRHSLHH